MVGKMHPTQVVHPGCDRSDGDLVWMHRKFKFPPQKVLHMCECQFQVRAVMREDDKIISIADVIFRLELVLHKLVKLVHVYVHEELRREVAEW